MREFALRLSKKTGSLWDLFLGKEIREEERGIAVEYLHLEGALAVSARDFRLKLAAVCHYRPLSCLLAKLRMPGANSFLFGTSRYTTLSSYADMFAFPDPPSVEASLGATKRACLKGQGSLRVALVLDEMSRIFTP